MMLVLDGLTRYYGSFLALDHLSLTIHDGELHGFVGPNGAGKTTTMRILATLLKPTEGTGCAGRRGRRGPSARNSPPDGYMPDFFGVYDRLKAWEYLDFYARCYGFGQKERRRLTDSPLELVNLTDKRDSYVDVLSRGMKQRLCLGTALIHDPRLLILDEPASGMDPRARAEMKGILRTLKDMGKTVLISSHILPELSEMCDSLTIIDHGRLVFSGSVEELGRHMSGNAPIRVRLAAGAEADAIEAAVTLIRQYPGVTGVGREEGNVLTVDFDGGEDATAGLLKQLAAGAPLVDFHRPPLNLEKVFMEVTQGE